MIVFFFLLFSDKFLIMPVPSGNNETNGYKKQRRWSLIGILSRKKKFKKSQESVDFCPYDGKINQKVAQNNHLKPSSDCPIEQYTCSPRLIRRCNSLQYTDKMSAYSNITGRPSAFDEWKSSQQSVYSSGSSACYSDIGAHANRNVGNGNQSAAYYYNNNNNIQEEYAEQTFPVSANIPAVAFRCYRNPINYNDNRDKSSGYPRKLTGKKIPPPPPPRDPNVKALYCFRNNRLVSRESDSTYFSQGSDDDCSEKEHRSVDDEPIEPNGGYCGDGPTEAKKPGSRSRRPIQICDVKTLSTESADSCRTQTVEEALQELENIYNSLGLSDDEDLLDRAERRDLPTPHQNMRYRSSDDELDCVTFKRILPKSPRRSGVPDIVSDDMAYRRLHKKETKPQSFVPGSFLLVLPTVYNLDTSPRPPGEPDITLDDVVFRSRRQNLNFLKIPDRQPPFGIPLGPIVGAAPSDYLHAVPEGRYKPTFRRRKVPDTVEDDLAFRNLRKDNKYKTCIDFSFVHRNMYCKIDDGGGGGVPNAAGHYGNNNKLKNDTHWIIKKTKFPDSSNRGSTNRRLKLLFDDSVATTADSGQNLMVVKINHHKPIVLTGFTLDEANQLSMSFFRANLLLHHDPPDNNNDNTTMAYRAPPQLIDNYYCNNNSNCSSSNNNSSDTADLVKSDTAPAVKRRRPIRDGNLDGLTVARKRGGVGVGGRSDVTGKNQPNFRELIEREYAHRTYPSLMMTENPTADYDGRRRRRRDENNTIKSRFIKINNNSNNTIAVHSTDGGAGAIITLGPKTGGGDEPNRDNRTTGAPSSAAVVEDEPDDSASSLSEYRGPDHAATTTTALGYTEVCLYITVYIYQLFNVNAYSYGTLIALILLVALHVCRRLS